MLIANSARPVASADVTANDDRSNPTTHVSATTEAAGLSHAGSSATGKATAGENKQRDPEERAFRASEEQQADERTGDRAETRVAVRGEREREKETGAEKCGDDE